MSFVVSFLLAALTGLGIGSGGLLVLYLTLIGGKEQLEAQALNLLFFMLSSFCATVINLLKKRILFLPLVIIVLFGIPGALMGSLLSNAVGGGAVKIIFGSGMFLLGMAGLLGKY